MKLWHALLLAGLFVSIPLAFAANTMFSGLSSITGANTASGDQFIILDVSDTTHGAGGTAKTITRSELATLFSVPTKYTLGSDYTNNSTTGTEVTGIGPMTVSASGSFFLDCRLMVQSAATTTSPKFGTNFTGTATQFTTNAQFPSEGVTAATGQIDDTANATTGQVWAYADATATSTTSPNLGPWTGIATANANVPVHVEAHMTTSNTGDIELWAGSEVASSTITIKAGSFCVVWTL